MLTKPPPLISCAHDLTVAATFRMQPAEHIVEVRCMLGMAAHTTLQFATCGADDEVGDFKARLARAFGGMKNCSTGIGRKAVSEVS